MLADEIRKLSEKVDANEKEASGRYDRLLILIGVTQDGTYERINLLATDNEKMQAQLTALRAEADKGRERMDDGRKALMNVLLRVEKQREPCEVCAGKRRVDQLLERKWNKAKPETVTVDQIMAAKEGRAARKKKQERKRPGRKSR